MHLRNLQLSKEEYIFQWTSKKLALFNLEKYLSTAAKNIKEIDQFIEEVIENIHELILTNHVKSREVVMRLPMKAKQICQYLESYPEI